MRIEQGERNGRRACSGMSVSRDCGGASESVHGGVMAGLFDELMGAAQSLTGRPGGVTVV